MSCSVHGVSRNLYKVRSSRPELHAALRITFTETSAITLFRIGLIQPIRYLGIAQFRVDYGLIHLKGVEL